MLKEFGPIVTRIALQRAFFPPTNAKSWLRLLVPPDMKHSLHVGRERKHISREGVLAYLCRLTSLMCRFSPMKNHSFWQPGMILPRRDGGGSRHWTSQGIMRARWQPQVRSGSLNAGIGIRFY